jgi:glycosyltransferase involved in cell wall biosynthesis
MTTSNQLNSIHETLEDAFVGGGTSDLAGCIPGFVTIVIPAYNEKETLEALVRRVEAVPLSKEIVIVDDGSTDGTRDIAVRLAAEGRVRAIFATRNRGKGMAFRLALERARGEAVIIQDADLEYDPSDIPRVVSPILSGAADVCYGSRILGKNRGRSSFSFYWGGRLLSWFASVLYGVRVTDEAAGYKAFRTESLRSIPLQGTGFELEPEMTAKVFREGLRYCEVPVSYQPRPFSAGKKIRWQDGLIALWNLLFWRISSY